MIVVISDLHFEEEASDVIPGRDGRPDVMFQRNLNPRAYRNFIAQMAEQVARRKVQEFWRLLTAGTRILRRELRRLHHDRCRRGSSLSSSPEVRRRGPSW